MALLSTAPAHLDSQPAQSAVSDVGQSTSNEKLWPAWSPDGVARQLNRLKDCMRRFLGGRERQCQPPYSTVAKELATADTRWPKKQARALSVDWPSRGGLCAAGRGAG